MNSSLSEEKIQSEMEMVKDDMNHFETHEYYEKVITNDNMTSTLDELEQHLFGKQITGEPLDQSREDVATTEVIEDMDGVVVNAENITAPETVDVSITEDL